MSVIHSKKDGSVSNLLLRDTFNPTDSQTVFTLSVLPNATQIANSFIYLDGQKLKINGGYTISGSQLTITLPYDLKPNRFLIEVYF